MSVELPFRLILFWGGTDLPGVALLIKGNCREFSGAPFLTISPLSVTLRILSVSMGDKKVIGVVVSASCSSAFKSSSRFISCSAVCNALATGLGRTCEEDMLPLFLTAIPLPAAPPLIRLNLGVGNLGVSANTSLKLMLMGVPGSPPTALAVCLFFPDPFKASGEIQIMLHWLLEGILGVLTPASPPASNPAKYDWYLLQEPDPSPPGVLLPGVPQKPYIPRGVLVTERELRPPPGEKRP